MTNDQIPGIERVIDWFGLWPTFHDSEILSLHLNRDGESTLRLSTWRASNDVAADGRFARTHEAIVVFTFSDIRSVEINGEDVNRQNVISGLSLTERDGVYHVDLGGSYGLAGQIVAGRVEVDLEAVTRQ